MEHQKYNDVADHLFRLIRPYYKSMWSGGEHPDFRKTLKPNEVDRLLQGIHSIILEIKKEQLVA